jgi:hypothetical protein
MRGHGEAAREKSSDRGWQSGQRKKKSPTGAGRWNNTGRERLKPIAGSGTRSRRR